MTSPKTTLTGLGGALVIIGAALKAWFDGDPATNIDWALVVPGLLSSFGLVFARDNDVTSEAAGASDAQAKAQ